MNTAKVLQRVHAKLMYKEQIAHHEPIARSIESRQHYMENFPASVSFSASININCFF